MPTTLLDDDNVVAMMKRAIAEPGKFDTTWPDLGDDEVAALVMDGFAAARMDGWFSTSTLDVDALEVTPDLSLPALALCVSYASVRVLRQRLLTLQAGKTYKAGPTEVSTTSQSNVLVALLKSSEDDINRLRVQVLNRVTPAIGDLTAVRLLGSTGWDFLTSELPRAGVELSRYGW